MATVSRAPLAQEDLSPEWRSRIEGAVGQERSRLVDRAVLEAVTKKLKVQDLGGTH